MAATDFTLTSFVDLLRDHRWRNEEEIKFYADDRAGASSQVWTKAIRPNGSLTLDTILHLKSSKVSIYVKRLELMHQGLRKLAASLARTGYFSPTIAGMYSPSAVRSTPNHVDPCDVLAIQLHGRKSWTVDGRAATKNATPRQTDARPGSFDFREPTQYTTEVGDALFIPRGFLHNAMSGDDDSLHLVIGLLPLTWFDVVSELVQQMCDNNPEIRGSILDQSGGDFIEGPSEEVVASLLSLADPDSLREASKRLRQKRAREHMFNSFGQVFEKSTDDLT